MAARNHFSSLEHHVFNRIESEVGEELAQPGLCTMQVAIVTETTEPAGPQPRLRRIDLPGMQIENDGTMLQPVDPRDSPASPPIGKNPKIPSACDWQIQRSETSSGARHFEQRSRRPFDRIGLPRRHRDPVSIVTDRKNARVVPLFQQDVERPERPWCNRVTRSAVTNHSPPRRLLQELLGPAHIFPKRIGCLVVDEAVGIPMRGDLMPALGNRANQLRVSLRHPPEHEKCAPGAELVEDVQQSCRVGDDPALHLLPRAAWHDAVKDADVKVIFDVNTHRIDDRLFFPRHHAPRRSNTVFTVLSMMNTSSAIDTFLM